MSTGRIATLALALTAAALGGAPELAHAHKLAPSYLSLTEGGDGSVAVLWKTPRVAARGARIAPSLPCEPQGDPALEVVETAWVVRSELRCDGSLVGLELAVDGLETSGTDALVHVTLADGRSFRAILTAEAPTVTVPERERLTQVAGQYLLLGAEHLATGIDHVLFVLGLLLLLRGGRPLLWAVTAFTLGHSVTLALAVLGHLRVPSDLVEIAIAASLVVLAVEVLRKEPGHPVLLERWPGLLPFGFGLIHGLGFVGALTELGLPEHAIPLALASFNVGIELGQLALIALAWPVFAVLRRSEVRWPTWLAELPATAIGGLGFCFVLQRMTGWLLS